MYGTAYTADTDRRVLSIDLETLGPLKPPKCIISPQTKFSLCFRMAILEYVWAVWQQTADFAQSYDSSWPIL